MSTDEEGHRVLPGVEGKQGERGKQGIQGEPPGGALRLTDRRLLVIYLFIIISGLILTVRTETNTREIRNNNFETCRDFTAVIRELNTDPGNILQLPDCERLRP